MKKSLVKIIALLVAVTVSVGLFTGCGKKNSDKNEQGQTVISVGGWPSKEGATMDAFTERKNLFETNNPDIQITPDTWAFDLKSFYAKAAGGQLPTVYNVHFTEIASIIDSGYSADLTDSLKKRGYDGMFNQQILNMLTKDGKVYGFPTAAYVLGLTFNVEMFEAAGLLEADGTPKQPKDLYEMVDFAVKIKKATGKPGLVFPTAGNNGGWIFNPVAWSFGVDFMEQDADGKWKATFNTPEAVEALQFIKDLKWKYDILPSNTLINGEEMYKTFATGNAGMVIAAGDMPGRMVKYGMTPDQLGIMAFPAGPKRHVTLMGGTFTAIEPNATKDQIEASIRWTESSNNFKLTSEYKTNQEKSIQNQLSNNQLVGIKNMSVWSKDSEALKFQHQLIDENANSNPNHVRLYNEFVANCPAELQAEEPVCAQGLYSTLDGCIQEVLANKEADCAELIAKAASDFQSNYLDNLTY
ncbi:MAG: extracellular solute-binding protein [Clostridia bacterium]|nr:extracellular solute-binding protein [Clostridia bacterium]